MLQNQSSWGLIPKGFPIRKYSIFHAVRLETPTLNPPPPMLLKKSSFDTGEKAQAKPITELSLPGAGQLYGGTSCGRLREGASIEKVTPWDWPGGSEKIMSLISDWWGGPTLGGWSHPGLEVLGTTRKQSWGASQKAALHQGSASAPASMFLPCPDFFQWRTVIWKCQPHNPFFSKWFGHSASSLPE